MIRYLISLMAVLFLWPAVVLADLSGTWIGDDGGRYYLRQVDSNIYWYGEREVSNPAWANVFYGKLSGDRIEGRWADVPKGRTNSAGKLRLKIKHNGNILVATEKSGGFGGNQWTRDGYSSPRTQPPKKHVTKHRNLKEDCIEFDPNRAQVKRIERRWKIVDGSHWLFDFGGKKGEAIKAMGVIRHYGINQSCYVGRPQPSLKYLLVSGSAPSGATSQEDCIAFNPNKIQVKKVNDSWKIVDGSHWVFDFGSKAKEAQTGFAVIRKHGFNRSCYVGRPHPSFEYLRRE